MSRASDLAQVRERSREWVRASSGRAYGAKQWELAQIAASSANDVPHLLDYIEALNQAISEMAAVFNELRQFSRSCTEMLADYTDDDVVEES